MPTIDIIIPSFNGKKLLEKQLPVVIKNSPEVNKIIVVDDGSIDGTVEFLAKEYPQIKCISNIVNQGFTKSVNIGVGESRADLIVFLNNDVYPEPKYLQSSVKYFDDPKIFAVTFNETNSSWPLVSFSGKVQYIKGEKTDKPMLSAWASGGSSIIRRSLWVVLGGFSTIFTPGYWEDIDIGWRAWRMGYKIIWDPKSVVVHQHESTFSQLDPGYISMVKQRNELLFNWQNITDPVLFREHLLFLLRQTIQHPGYIKVIVEALKNVQSIKRTSVTPYSDGFILHTVNRPYSP